MPLIHRIRYRKRRLLLPDDVAEVGIGSECRRLVEYRLPHRGAHGFARLVVAKLEVLPDFRVGYVFQTGGSKAALRKKRRELKKRESVCGENKQCIPQEFIRARTEGIQMPAGFKDFGNLGDTHKAPRIVVEGIEANRNLRIGGLNDDKLAAQVTMDLLLPCGNGLQEKRCRIAMKVEIYEPAPSVDVLLTEIPQKRAFAAP